MSDWPVAAEHGGPVFWGRGGGSSTTARRRPPQTTASRRGNLPAPSTSFVGRERDLAEVGRLLGGARLLTLTGAGGVGKSRLAREVAAGLLDELPDGAWLVELAALADPRLLPQSVAAALGLREQPGRTVSDVLVGYLRPRELLLILDNCEHLAEACAELGGALLRACPGLRLLATSRRPLDLPVETLWRVPSLSLPDDRPWTTGHGPPLSTHPGHSHPSSFILHPSSVLRSESARLFVERARAALPSFRLGDEQAGAVAEICRRLDGIPLALELAAAVVPVLTVEQIAGRLDDRFRLLTAGTRTALPRHRTLRALIDWSHDQLDERERVLFRRLAVFAGGWTLEAAEGVCAGEGFEADAVLPLLTRMVAASLATTERVGGEMRLSLVETIREYGLEKLRAAGEEQWARRRHLEWAAALAERAEPRLWTSEQRQWLDQLERELPNLRAALAWSLASNDPEQGLRLVTTIWRFWEQRGHIGEVRQWLGALLGRPAAEQCAVRAMGVALAGYFAYLQGNLTAAPPIADEALRLARAAGHSPTLCYALIIGAILQTSPGDPADLDRAQARFEEAIALARAAGWELGVRLVLRSLGELARMRGDFERAGALLEECLALSQAAGDAYWQAWTLSALGHLSLQAGDVAGATERLRGALVRWDELRDVQNVPQALEPLGWAAAAEGRATRSARLLGAAEALDEAVGAALIPIWRADHERVRADVQAALGERAFAAAWRRGRALSYEAAVAYALEPEGGPRTAARLASSPSESESRPLTARQRQIAALVGAGRSNAEIAAALVVSERTVEWHVANLFGKLGLGSRTQLAVWAVEQGLAGNLAEAEVVPTRSA